MPRKMAGIAMITIEASIVAIVMLSVVLDSATHRYRSARLPSPSRPPGLSPLPRPSCPFPPCPARCCTVLHRTIINPTANKLLARNYLPKATISRVAGEPATGGE